MSEFSFGVSGFGFGVLGDFEVSGPNLGCQGRIQDVGTSFRVSGSNLGYQGLACGVKAEFGMFWLVSGVSGPNLGCQVLALRW